LKARNILAVFHYLPLHLSVTENLSDRLVRLPFYNDLTEEDQERVVRAATEFRYSSATFSVHPCTPNREAEAAVVSHPEGVSR
jgi:hypothetical protein